MKNLLTIIVLYLLLTISQALSLPPCEGDESKWQDCEGSLTSASGTIFIGVFKDGIFEGKNEEKSVRYVGEYKNGTQNGQGTYTWGGKYEGQTYVGRLKDGKFNGQGTITFAGGNKYVGGWKDSKFNGQGTYTFVDGNKYVGEWKDGNQNGQGTYTYADGKKYIGEYKDGKRNGQGTYTFADGKVWEGQWRNGDWVSGKKYAAGEYNANSSGNDNEIVINKKGESILLKSNGTWELILNEGEEEKVVFLIIKATDHINSVDRKDDMDEFSHYDNYVGCEYVFEVQNKTNFKIKVAMFKVATNNKKLFNRYNRDSLVQWNQIIESGKSESKNSQYSVGVIKEQVGQTIELPTPEEDKIWKSQYGCEAQKGSIYITTADMDQPDIIFSKDSGISDDAKSNFIKGSSNGIYPLIERINLK